MLSEKPPSCPNDQSRKTRVHFGSHYLPKLGYLRGRHFGSHFIAEFDRHGERWRARDGQVEPHAGHAPGPLALQSHVHASGQDELARRKRALALYKAHSSPANLPASSFNPASMRSATERTQYCTPDLTEASRFPHHASLCIAAYGFLILERSAFPPSARWRRERPALSGRSRSSRTPEFVPNATWPTRSRRCAGD